MWGWLILALIVALVAPVIYTIRAARTDSITKQTVGRYSRIRSKDGS